MAKKILMLLSDTLYEMLRIVYFWIGMIIMLLLRFFPLVVLALFLGQMGF